MANYLEVHACLYVCAWFIKFSSVLFQQVFVDDFFSWFECWKPNWVSKTGVRSRSITHIYWVAQTHWTINYCISYILPVQIKTKWWEFIFLEYCIGITFSRINLLVPCSFTPRSVCWRAIFLTFESWLFMTRGAKIIIYWCVCIFISWLPAVLSLILIPNKEFRISYTWVNKIICMKLCFELQYKQFALAFLC